MRIAKNLAAGSTANLEVNGGIKPPNIASVWPNPDPPHGTKIAASRRHRAAREARATESPRLPLIFFTP